MHKGEERKNHKDGRLYVIREPTPSHEANSTGISVMDLTKICGCQFELTELTLHSCFLVILQ